jgi:hypothetical protein
VSLLYKSSSDELDSDAGRDLTSDELQQIEKLVRQISSKTANLHDLVAKLDATERSVIAQLKSCQQDEQNARASEQRALNAKLESQHEAVKGSQSVLQTSMAAVGRAQSNAASVQRRVLSDTSRTRKQTARMSQDIASHHRAAYQQHQKTRDLIVATFKGVQITAVKEVSISPSSGREIVYQGRRQDVIIPTLYSIKTDLDQIFDKLYTDHSKDVHPDNVSWLKAELQNLLASAAQEQARLHPGSTATSFDTWIYPVKKAGQRSSKIQADPVLVQHDHPAKRTARRSNKTQSESVLMQHDLDTTDSNSTLSVRERGHKLFRFRTRNGTFRVRMPRREFGAQMSDDSDEVGVSLQPSCPDLATVNARFVRLNEACVAPRIFGQLNIFLPIPHGVVLSTYNNIIRYGSIPDIDRALRTGTICAYRNWKIEGQLTGVNPLFWVSLILNLLQEGLLIG